MIKKLAPYTKGYRLLMLFAIACSAGEAVLELTLPQVMSDIVDIGIANGDRGYILMAGLKMVIMALRHWPPRRPWASARRCGRRSTSKYSASPSPTSSASPPPVW